MHSDIAFLCTANTSQYAHYVFNTLDQDHSGLLSFEVSSHPICHSSCSYSHIIRSVIVARRTSAAVESAFFGTLIAHPE